MTERVDFDETIAEHLYHLSCYLAQEAEWFKDNKIEGWFYHLSRDAEFLRMRADRESLEWSISDGTSMGSRFSNTTGSGDSH